MLRRRALGRVAAHTCGGACGQDPGAVSLRELLWLPEHSCPGLDREAGRQMNPRMRVRCAFQISGAGTHSLEMILVCLKFTLKLSVLYCALLNLTNPR